MFDFDNFRMRVVSAFEPAVVGGIAKGTEPLWVVSVAVSNVMLLPARWGWQYVTPELVMQGGASFVVAFRLTSLLSKRTIVVTF